MDEKRTSAFTSVNKDKVPQLFTWALSAGPIKEGSSVFDYGCGRWPSPVRTLLGGAGVAKLDQWDPNWFPDADYIPFCGYDAVCLSNVLNVIERREDRIMALKTAWDAVKPGGVMLVTVYETDGSGASGPSRDGCWQERRRLESYMDDELAPYLGHVVPGTRLWVSLAKPEDGTKWYPPVGAKLSLCLPTGSAYPYTVVGPEKGGGIRIRAARLEFDGPRYFDSVPDRILPGIPGEDREEVLTWKPKAGEWGLPGRLGAVAVFGKWFYAPYLD